MLHENGKLIKWYVLPTGRSVNRMGNADLRVSYKKDYHRVTVNDHFIAQNSESFGAVPSTTGNAIKMAVVLDGVDTLVSFNTNPGAPVVVLKTSQGSKSPFISSKQFVEDLIYALELDPGESWQWDFKLVHETTIQGQVLYRMELIKTRGYDEKE